MSEMNLLVDEQREIVRKTDVRLVILSFRRNGTVLSTVRGVIAP